MIPYGRQDITDEDISAVLEILKSDFLTQGPACPAFEKKLCDYTGVNYTVAVNSCTSALHIACVALGLGPGDLLWTSPISFVASANCSLYCGATVDFVDVEPDTALMSVEHLERKLESAERDGKLPKIVVPVHFSGQPCDMEGIYKLSKKYKFSVIEDAAHAIGATYRGERVGNCRFSDITVFSYHPVKIITTGEGGTAMTNNVELFERMVLLRSHGVTRDPEKITRRSEGTWYYEQIDLGYNYRMTDIQAALGSSQLSRINEYVSKRKKIADWYNKNLINNTIDTLIQKKDRTSSHHLYVIRVNECKINRNKLFEQLKKLGVGVNLHYIPIYKHPYHYKCLELENAETYYRQAITLPLFPSIQQKEIESIVNNIRKLLG